MDTRGFRHSTPYTLAWDHAPVDLSFVFADEAPAGKHGFLTVKGNRFVFEDGTDARFWGTNFNGGACFPSHAHSEKVARRLAQFGVNIVRFHQMDADWANPNLFQYTKGARLDNTQHFDPESLDCLDYLIACLKQRGIYVYMDMLTYRLFRSGDGVEAAEQLPDSAKPYSCFDPHLIALQKEFSTLLWTHLNPYTGLAYKDDPAIVLTEVTNESDLYHLPTTVEPYRTALEQRFLGWLASRGEKSPLPPIDFKSQDSTMIEFLGEVQKQYYRDIIDHLRAIGVRIPVTGTNWSIHLGLLAAQMVTDFTDSHNYWYDWCWTAAEKKFNNRSMLGEVDPLFGALGFFRVVDKPFFVSEWDDPWPNEWRAESVLLMAAVAALQGWQGAAIHTYRYSTRENTDCIGQPITSDAIGGVFYRGGVFDTFNDPAKFGLFYHAALLLRRGDVRPAEQTIEIDATVPHPKGAVLTLRTTPALRGALEMHGTALRLKGSGGVPGKSVQPGRLILPPDAREIRSDTGQLYRNLKERYGSIDTPRTKAVYGFLGSRGAVALSGLRITLRTDFGVIAVSSLTDDPIDRSSNLLLTAVGRADNTGSRYNEDHTVQLDVGHGPIQIETIDADIALTTTQAHLRAWAINPDGFPIGPIPAERVGGVLRFTLGTHFPSMYYLIQAR